MIVRKAIGDVHVTASMFQYNTVEHVLKPTCLKKPPVLTLKVLVVTIHAQWEEMGDVGSARYEPALLPPCPTIRVLRYSN